MCPSTNVTKCSPRSRREGRRHIFRKRLCFRSVLSALGSPTSPLPLTHLIQYILVTFGDGLSPSAPRRTFISGASASGGRCVPFTATIRSLPGRRSGRAVRYRGTSPTSGHNHTHVQPQQYMCPSTIYKGHQIFSQIPRRDGILLFANSSVFRSSLTCGSHLVQYKFLIHINLIFSLHLACASTQCT